MSLRAGSELEGLQLTEHIHVSSKLELGGINDLFLSLINWLGLKSHTYLLIFILNLLTLVLVLHILADGELVVLSVELDPLTSLLADGNHSFLVFDLSLTEDIDILLLVSVFKGLQFPSI